MREDIHVAKKGFACNFTTFPHSKPIKFFLLILPLLLLTGFLALSGPSVHPRLWSFSSFSCSFTSNAKDGSCTTSSIDVGEDLLPRMVVVGAQSTAEEKEFAVSDDESLLLNHSSSPQLAVLVKDLIEEVNVTQENITIVSINEDGINAPTNESLSDLLPFETKRPMEYSNLEKLEAALQKARAAIKESQTGNQTEDPDFVPIGPMYRNARVFHRSYVEMEKRFKVFVYEEGEPPVFHNGPCKSIYSMEGNFIHRLEIDEHFRTKDPEKAHVYFLPFSVAMMVHFVYVRDSHDFGPIRRTVNDYINLISGRYRYWNRSLGADHFMLACHDWGPETSFSDPYLGKNSIRALCNANTSERFDPIKDVSFPEINLQSGSIRGLVGGPSPSRRSILAFFAGGLHGPIRPILLEQWENKDDDLRVHRYLPKGLSYYEMMRKSKFCLCPSGYEVASPRVVEAIYTGCVPVLISEHYVPPFSDVLNWKSFSVEVSVRDIPNLKKILTSISPRQYIRMHRRVLQVRRHFELHSPPKRFDVFHMILHSIWLRRLNVRIHDTQFGITN